MRAETGVAKATAGEWKRVPTIQTMHDDTVLPTWAVQVKDTQQWVGETHAIGREPEQQTEAYANASSRIITYIREDEDGTGLRAAGWVCEGCTAGRGWHSARRSRSNRNAWIAKQRWSRTLRPKPITAFRLKAAAAPEDEWVLGRTTGTTIHAI